MPNQDDIRYSLLCTHRKDGDGGLCVRPKDMFLSEVDRMKYPDAKQVYRFELVDEFKEDGR